MQQLLASSDSISIPFDYQLENNYLHSTFDQKKSIPDHIWINRFRCANFQACIEQNGTDFGFIPMSPLEIYTGNPIYWETISEVIEMHRLIKQTGLPNYLGVCIPVPTQLRLDRWRFHLNDFGDK